MVFGQFKFLGFHVIWCFLISANYWLLEAKISHSCSFLFAIGNRFDYDAIFLNP